MIMARIADRGGQHGTHGGPGDDGHYHVAFTGGCCTRSDQATGQDQGLGHLRKHGVSSGDVFGFAMDL
jgi:hypothetical protein